VVSEHLVLIKLLYSNLFNVSYDDMNIVYVFRLNRREKRFILIQKEIRYISLHYEHFEFRFIYIYIVCIFSAVFGLCYRNREIVRLANWLFIVWYIYQILNSIYALTFVWERDPFVWLFDEWKAWVLSNSQKVHTITKQYRTSSC